MKQLLQQRGWLVLNVVSSCCDEYLQEQARAVEAQLLVFFIKKR